LRRTEAPRPRLGRLPYRLRAGALGLGAVPRAALCARVQRGAVHRGHRLLDPDAAGRPLHHLCCAHAYAGMTGEPSGTRQTPLAPKLAARITKEGPIGVADYRRACLSDPEYGYYRTRAAIGREGDFITAPEISQVFGELIGLWCAVVWHGMGSPSKLRLVEL